MKNIPDFAVSSQEAGFDKFLKVYNEYFKFDFFGNAKFYGAKNGEDYQTGQAWITPITPSQAIALLTGKQLTEGESDLVSDSEREAEIAKFKAYPYDPMSGNIEDEIDHAKRNIYKRGFKDGFEKANSVSHQQTAHLQQQLNTLTSEIKRFQEKYDENGYDCSNEIKLLRIENHIDSTLSFYHKEVTDLQQQLKEAKELLDNTDDLLTRLEDYTHGKDGESITELRALINKFLTRNK